MIHEATFRSTEARRMKVLGGAMKLHYDPETGSLQWLADAHRDLDAAVAAAYGWPADISEDDALAKLLELNLARADAAAPAPAELELDDGD